RRHTRSTRDWSSDVCSSDLDQRYPEYVAWLRANEAGRAVWFPIHDIHAPSLDALVPLLDALRTRLARGESVLLHCGAGVGRAGRSEERRVGKGGRWGGGGWR